VVSVGLYSVNEGPQMLFWRRFWLNGQGVFVWIVRIKTDLICFMGICDRACKEFNRDGLSILMGSQLNGSIIFV